MRFPWARGCLSAVGVSELLGSMTRTVARAFYQQPDDLSRPTDEELREVLARPDVQAGLRRYLQAERDGTLVLHSNNEARAIVGLPPLPDDRP